MIWFVLCFGPTDCEPPIPLLSEPTQIECNDPRVAATIADVANATGATHWGWTCIETYES